MPPPNTSSPGTESLARRVVNAGAVFVGDWTAQVAGDYAIGSNHVLPTAGAARFRGGLNAADFVKLVSVQRVTKRGLEVDRQDDHDAGAGRGPRSPRVMTRIEVRQTMTTIQGVPDLGPGLRLHLNENTGGCSPKVVDGGARVRRPGARHLSRLSRRDPRDRGVPRRRSRSHRPDQRPRRRHPARLDRLSRQPHARSAGRARRAVDRPRRARRRSWSRSRRSSRTCTRAQALGARVVSVPPGKDFAFPLDGMLRAHHAEHAHRLRQQSEQPERPADCRRTRFTASRAKPATRWCSSTRRITIFSARTSSRKRRIIRTC